MNHTLAFIPAGGISARYGAENKLMVPLATGETALERVVRIFADSEQISSVIVAANESLLDRLTISGNKIHVIKGGQSRSHSVWKMIQYVEHHFDIPDIILVHDAARPFITKQIINASIELATSHGAMTTVGKIYDMVRQVKDSDVSIINNDGVQTLNYSSTLNRDQLLRIYTPQAFKYQLLKRAYFSEFGVDAFNLQPIFMDCASVVETIHQIAVLPSDQFNLKITTKEDKRIIDALLASHYAND